MSHSPAIKNRVALCKPCAASLESKGTTLTFHRGGVNFKVLCDSCKRRRFGALYTVEDGSL